MSESEQWIYYKHAIIPTCSPHEEPDLTCINDGTIWKGVGKNAVFARWTTDFDRTENTDWWYIIQDNPIDIKTIKRSHRKKINKGLSNFECRVINPRDYAERMAEITLSAWENYPKRYRPSRDKNDLIAAYKQYPYLTFGCFNHDGLLCGFDGVEDRGSYWILAQGKTDPLYERGFELNAAMTYTEICFLKEDIKNGKYLTNGARNTVHETNFNEDLCHYYGFRKAYCNLHLAYNPKFKWLIIMLYPFKKALAYFKWIKSVNYLCNILQMEEVVRNQRG